MKDIVSEQESLFQSLTTETQRCIWHKVILKYFVNEDETISFEVSESYLYPKELN